MKRVKSRANFSQIVHILKHLGLQKSWANLSLQNTEPRRDTFRDIKILKFPHCDESPNESLESLISLTSLLMSLLMGLTSTVWKFANFSPMIFCKNSVKLILSLKSYTENQFDEKFLHWGKISEISTLWQENISSNQLFRHFYSKRCFHEIFANKFVQVSQCANKSQEFYSVKIEELTNQYSKM